MQVSVKLDYETRKLLRLIAAHTDEQIQAIAHRLVKAEWERIQEKEKDEQVKSDRQPESV